jgi:ribonuclease HI
VHPDSIKANTAEETAAALVAIKHKWRIYSDGECDGNGAKGVWGASGFGVAIYLVQDDGSVKEISDLCGPVVTEEASVWWMGAQRGTNQTGELCGVMQGLL